MPDLVIQYLVLAAMLAGLAAVAGASIVCAATVADPAAAPALRRDAGILTLVAIVAFLFIADAFARQAIG